MGQHGPKHYKSWHIYHCFGSEMTLEFLFGACRRLFYRNTLYILILYSIFPLVATLCVYRYTHIVVYSILPLVAYVYIYIDAVVFNYGVLSFKGSKMLLFFASWWNQFQTPKRVSPRWNRCVWRNSLRKWPPAVCHPIFSNGALVLRNIGSPLSNGCKRMHAPHFWTHLFAFISMFVLPS